MTTQSYLRDGGSYFGSDNRPIDITAFPPQIFVRPPRTGVEHVCGLTRTRLYELARQGLIESKAIRPPGKARGIRVFKLKSILDYIERCAPDQKGVAL